MKFPNIFERRDDEIKNELDSNAQSQEEITRREAELAELVKLKQSTEDQEAELLGEQITTELAVEEAKEEAKLEEQEKQAKIAQLKSDLETKITELEKLGLDSKPLKQALENLEEGLSLEWGPELGKMSWYKAQEKVVELNKTLKEGEKSWRLPTRQDWEDVFKAFTEAKKQGASEKELKEILEEIRQKNNLQSDHYWSSTTYERGTVARYVGLVDASDGFIDAAEGSDDPKIVRCVR
jgi:hypothetical protein